MRIPLSLLAFLLLLGFGCDPKTPADTDADSFIYPDVIPKPAIALQYNNYYGEYKQFVWPSLVELDARYSCPLKNGADDEYCNSAGLNGAIAADTYWDKCCLPDWQNHYELMFKWEMIESPTPDDPYTRISLDNVDNGGEGIWYVWGEENPTMASFRANVITPTPDGKTYKFKVSAKTRVKNGSRESEIVDKTDSVRVVMFSRLMIKLMWKEGPLVSQSDGLSIDMDLHLVKKQGMDWQQNLSGTAGKMCTYAEIPDVQEGTATHDDCWSQDGSYLQGGYPVDAQSIAWHAWLNEDNQVGGANYTRPENISLGYMYNKYPLVPPTDKILFSDDYLVVVNYNSCADLSGNNACTEGGGAYNVHGRVEIWVDDMKVPREGDDQTLVSDFVIRPGEYLVLNRIVWDQEAQGKWAGNAVVHDAFNDYQACQFDRLYCYNVDIWDRAAYETWVTAAPGDTYPFVGGGGTCYPYGTRE